jgi:hypothetical protein
MPTRASRSRRGSSSAERAPSPALTALARLIARQVAAELVRAEGSPATTGTADATVEVGTAPPSPSAEPQDTP